MLLSPKIGRPNDNLAFPKAHIGLHFNDIGALSFS